MRCCDHRLPVDRAGQQITRVGTPALRSAERLELLAFAQLALMHVGAARKGAAVAADDRDVRLRVEVEAPKRVRQMPHQLVAEGIEPIGPVQGQGGDLVLATILDEVGAAHLRPLYCLPMAPGRA